MRKLKSHNNLFLFFICYCIVSLLIGIFPVLLIGIRTDILDYALAIDSREFSRSLILFLSISLLSIIIASVSNRILEYLNHRASSDIDESIMKKTERITYPVLDSSEFHSLLDKAVNTSDLVATLTTSIGRCCTDLVTIVFTLVSMAVVSPSSAIMLMIALFFYAFLIFQQGSKTENFWPRYREKMKKTNYLSSLLTRGEFAHERKVFAYDEYIENACQTELISAEQDNCKTGKSRFRMEFMITVASSFYIVIVVLILLPPLKDGILTLGGFISLFYALQTLSKVSGDFCSCIFTVYTNLTWTRSYRDFMDLEEYDGDRDIPDMNTVEFRNVSFSYPGSDRCILKDVNFRISSGEHYALVGENGSGKSTIVKLMLGLYEPSTGEVLVDGIKVSELTLECRRKLFGAVFQSVARYPLSIRENVSLAHEGLLDDGSMSEIFKKLGFASELHDYDQALTSSNDNGSGLSGGEWQKLAVARTLVSSSSFVIMDEPNASLDPISEKDMYQAYGKILSGRTSLLITHRMGAVKDVDTILVLKDGKIVDEGSHSFLLSNCPYYKSLYDTQRDFYVTR